MNIEKTEDHSGVKKNKNTKKHQFNFGPERLFSTLELGSLVIERRFVRQLELRHGMFSFYLFQLYVQKYIARS